MSFISKLGKILGVAAPVIAAPFTGGASLAGLGASLKTALPDIIGGVGSALGGAAKASASNRGTTIDAMIEQQRLRDGEMNGANTANHNRDQLLTDQQKQMADELIARSQEGRASGNDAYKNMLHADYTANRTANYKPAMVNGKTLADYGFGPKASSADAIAGANAFKGEAMNRLQNGNPIPEPAAMPTPTAVQTAPTPFTIDPKLMQSGMFEKIAGIAGTGMSTFDYLNQLRNKARITPDPNARDTSGNDNQE